MNITAHRRFFLIIIFCYLSTSKLIAEETPWDVNHPPGTAYQAEIDTRSGTWMAVDISPDGKQLVFDLLGDLYLLPISGGEARPLTRGMAWDMQPRFSPDGRNIVYISDAAGGDNIWVIQTDGKQARQVSKEDFRLLNNPVWSPDGQFIAARKHFTSRRSLGAGEIWLYHSSGGSGLQLNKRPNEQKDLGEPAFSPDGRYVYFSRDSTPGDRFEYSKDSNNQIYEIFSLDRHTGKIESVISGPGGAVRPTPSPDGKYLAFVRRIRNQSALFLKDLKTDAIFPAYKKLDRDMQETWAIHGVYPGIAWTPDSRELVFWAQGKLWRLDIATQQAREIPFHVKDSREMREAQRLQNETAPSRFKTKMMRWVNVSPDGKQAVFQALGYLYIKDLPHGKPKRLTQQHTHFEFFPSFSSDGRWIVYSTWNDQSLGSIRKVSSRGGEGKLLTQQPGHYLEPRFSPDGHHIVFSKSGGGRITSPLHASKPGIYHMPAAGGAAVFISDEGEAPFFNKDSQRIFLTRYEGSGEELKTKLVSLDLHGDHLQEHIATDFASEFQLSPDENWLAYVERFQVYIAPFTHASQAIRLSADTKNLPVKKLSDPAGSYLHWSGNSKRLYWSLGAQLFSKSLQATFASAPEASENTLNDSPDIIDLGFEISSDQPQGLLALKNARLITLRGDEVIEQGTLLVQDNRIAAIGPSTQIKIPAHAHTIDVSGKTIIPGLIDAHWHGAHGNQQLTPQQNWYYYATLALGVTTVHDPSADSAQVFAASELQKAGLITAPRVFSTGTILYGARDFYTAEVENYAQAKTHLQRMQALGAFSVKSYNQPRRAQRQQILAAARETNMLVVPEGGSLFMHNMTMIIDGHTSIEHSLPVAAVYDDVKQLWSQSRTTYTPTLVVAYGGIWGERYWYQHSNVWQHPILSRFVPAFVLEPRSVRREMAPDEDYNHFNIARVTKELNELGVNVQLGAHGQREGLGAHWELWMFAQGGMSPLQALRAATLNGAKMLGMEKDLGSLEAGKLADLVVLDTNPLEDIYSSDQVHQVMVNGRLYDAKTLHEIGLRDKQRKPFFFE